MADQRRSDFYVVFTMSLCALGIKTIVNKFAISNDTDLILGVHALRSYLKLICEYDFHSLPNKNVSGAKDHDKTTSRSDRPWSAIFCVIVYFRYTFASCITIKHQDKNQSQIKIFTFSF